MKGFGFLAFCLIVFGLVLMPPVSYAGNTIKVGVIDTYTGPASALTIDILDAFKMSVTKINAAGGVLGRKIEYAVRNDEFKPDIGLNMAKELVFREKVDMLVGTTNSSGALAISDFCKKEKIPFIVTTSKAESITEKKGHRYVFRIGENTAMIGRATALLFSKKPYTKFWIAGDDYEFGHSVADSFWRNMKALKPEAQLLGTTFWKVGEADYVPYITSILAAKPEVLFAAPSGAGVVNFMKAAKTTGLNKSVFIYNPTGIEMGVLAPLGNNAAEGVLGTSNYLFYYPETTENKAFVEEFRKAYNRDPKIGALYGYVAAQLIAKGFQKAGKFDKEKFIDALEGLIIDTPVGRVGMRACDHQLALPLFAGVTTKTPKHDFLVASDIVTIPGKDCMQSCEEIKKLRSK